MRPKIMKIKEMLDYLARMYFEYSSEEIIVVNLTSCEVFKAYSPAELILNNSWNGDWMVEVTSFRNDKGHISATFNDNVEI